MTDIPAIFGGKRMFRDPVAFAKPTIPNFPGVRDEFESIMQSGMLTKGANLSKFEDAAASYLGVRNAIAVSSCTSGLMLAYQSLGLRGEVIVPSFTFMATVSALTWAGAKPKFVDVDLETTNIDCLRIEEAINERTCAIVAVHNFGNPADIEELERLAQKHDLPLIFDAAHGFGTLYQGATVGSQGDIHVFSLSPTKLLVAGEGGLVTTNDDEIAETIRVGREYGNDGNYDSLFAGINARMPEFNAALASEGLKRLESNAKNRNRLADVYRNGLGDLKGISFQKIRDGDRSSYKDFSIVVDPKVFGWTRDQLAESLLAEGIQTRNYYDPPVHKHKAYRKYDDGGNSLLNTERLASSCLSLPIWSHMEEETVRNICVAIKRIAAFRSEQKSAAARESI